MEDQCVIPLKNTYGIAQANARAKMPNNISLHFAKTLQSTTTSHIKKTR